MRVFSGMKTVDFGAYYGGNAYFIDGKTKKYSLCTIQFLQLPAENSPVKVRRFLFAV